MDVKISVNFDDISKVFDLGKTQCACILPFVATFNQVLRRLHRSDGLSLYMFGLGAGGRALINSGFFDSLLVGVIDNDTSKQGLQYKGMAVFSPDVLRSSAEALVLVVSDRYADIQRQLTEQFNIDEENIINIMPLYIMYQRLLDTTPIEYHLNSL